MNKKLHAYENDQPTEVEKLEEEEDVNKQAKRPAEGLCSIKRSRTFQDIFSDD